MPPPDGTIALEVLAMSDEVEMLVDWESRPAALMRSGEAYAVLSKDSGWVSVNRSEVIDSGTPISPSNFSKAFPMTDLSTIPTSPSPEDKVDISDTTTTAPSPEALSLPKNKAHSRNEYSHTYKASEDRWTSEGIARTLKEMEKEGKLPSQQKGKKDR